jgi:hypothetical protein
VFAQKTGAHTRPSPLKGRLKICAWGQPNRSQVRDTRRKIKTIPAK